MHEQKNLSEMWNIWGSFKGFVRQKKNPKLPYMYNNEEKSLKKASAGEQNMVLAVVPVCLQYLRLFLGILSLLEHQQTYCCDNSHAIIGFLVWGPAQHKQKLLWVISSEWVLKSAWPHRVEVLTALLLNQEIQGVSEGHTLNSFYQKSNKVKAEHKT